MEASNEEKCQLVEAYIAAVKGVTVYIRRDQFGDFMRFSLLQQASTVAASFFANPLIIDNNG